MVELKVCSFCGSEIEPGTGTMFVKKDGTVYLFCTNKCSKNMIDMSRVPRRVTWTRAYAREKEVRMLAPEPGAGKAASQRAGREHFQRDVAVQPLVLRAIDHTHPAFADLLDDFVMPEDLADHQ